MLDNTAAIAITAVALPRAYNATDLSIYEGSSISFDHILAIIPCEKDDDQHTILHVVENASSKSADKQVALHPQELHVNGLATDFIWRFSPSQSSPWLKAFDAADSNVRRHVVISGGSGTGLASAMWEHLVKPVLAFGGLIEQDYAVHATTSASSITELVKSSILPAANQGIAQHILLLSGDGGVVDIVNTLLSLSPSGKYMKPVLSLIPAGTGNALANSAVITSDRTTGLRTLFRGTTRPLPIFRATFSSGARLLVNEGQDERELDGTFDSKPVAHGAVVCSWGLHATLVADSDTTEYRKFGAERFKMAGTEALYPSDGGPPHAYKGKVSISRPGKTEWEVYGGNTHGYVLATFVSQLEAGFKISPASRPLDGKLRLVHFGALSGDNAMGIMSKAYEGGQHMKDSNVGYEEIGGLRIEFNEDDARWRRVCIDGTIVRVEQGGSMELSTDLDAVVDLIAQGDD